MSNLRGIEILRGAWGAVLLFAPREALQRVHGVTVDPTSVRVARILGARQLAQAVLSGASPSPNVLALGVWVDTAHACTALGLAAVDRSRVRAGLVDTVVAGTWAVVGYHDLTNAHPGRLDHDRLRDRLAQWALGYLPLGAPLRRVAAERRTG